ncbi:recombinase family protein [Rhodococcus sp. NPDC060176]|uniref:recombinase family protein n=1 Tax=Rhodococcus sp. NPDC060176 TaxID=3347062 RepID=UPI003667D27E
MSAGIYCRISKAVKNDEDDIDTLGVERQEQLCRELAQRLNLDVTDVYVDNNLSGKAGVKRPQYERLMTDILDGRITTVLAWKTDRLSRDRLALEIFYQLLRDHDTKLQTDQEGPVHLNTPDGALMAGIRAEIAQYERAATAERVKAQKRQKAQRGDVLPGRYRMFGYADKVRTAVDPVESVAVKALFDDYLAGISIRQLAKRLNTQGLASTGGRRWDSKSVSALLRHAAYAGLREFDGQIVSNGKWPKIIDKSVYERVQVKLSSNVYKGPHGNTKHLLAGILYCELCLTKLISASTRYKDQTYRTYRCSPNYGCGKLSRRAEPMEQKLLEVTSAALAKVPRNVEPFDTSELDAIQLDIDLLAAARKEGRITVPIFIDQVEALTKQKDALTKSSVSASMSTSTVDEFVNGTIDQQREVIKSFFPAIGVRKIGGGRKFDLSQLIFDSELD